MLAWTRAARAGSAVEESESAKRSRHSERTAILGSAYKRKAAVLARSLLESENGDVAEEFHEAIKASGETYKRVSRDAKGKIVKAYQALNWLALQSLDDDGKKSEYVSLCLECAKLANENFRKEPDFWNAIMVADAFLVECLYGRGLGVASQGRVSADEKVWQLYSQALHTSQVTPKSLESVTEQIKFLALFFDAKAKLLGQTKPDEEYKRLAESLSLLAKRIGAGNGSTG